jgi:hypothetical protein
MIHSSHRHRKIKALAEMLALIATAEPAPCRLHSGREATEWLREESVSEFGAALHKYCSDHMPGLNRPPKKHVV